MASDAKEESVGNAVVVAASDADGTATAPAAAGIVVVMGLVVTCVVV